MSCHRPHIIIVLLILFGGVSSAIPLSAQDSSRLQLYYFREVPDSIPTSLQAEKQFLYANDSAFWSIQQAKPVALDGYLDFWRRPWFKIIIYLIIFVILLLSLLAVMKANNMFIFYSCSRKKRSMVLPEGTILDWGGKIATAERDQHYRMAIRFHFLELLYRLHDHGLISYHPETTNADYLNSMRKYQGYSEFKSLTRIYEYAWYGDFEISESVYQQVAERFNHLKVSIR